MTSTTTNTDLTDSELRSRLRFINPGANVEDISTVAQEARNLQYGDREDAYGHPRVTLTRTAAMWSVLLGDKLDEGSYITPEDVARMMTAMKLARDTHTPKRDNRVDAIGYLIALDRLETGL